IVPDDALMDAIELECRCEKPVRHGPRGRGNGNRDLADGDREADHEGEEKAGGDGKCRKHPPPIPPRSGNPHRARPKALMPFASVSMPSIVRIVGFIDWASIITKCLFLTASSSLVTGSFSRKSIFTFGSSAA